MRSRTWGILYLAAVGLFLLGILVQVYLAGLGVLGRQPEWESHIGLGHSLGGAVLFMIVFAYAGRLPRPLKRLTWGTFAIYILLADIVIFMRDSAPKAAALHPVLAVLLFAGAGACAVRAWQLVRAYRPETAPAEPGVSSSARRAFD